MTDLFQDTTEDDNVEVDPNKKYFEELVGDGKKFKSTEDLARGKYESDSYIRILEKRLDEMRNDHIRLRDDYNSRARLEELVDQLKNPQLASSANNQNANEDTDQPKYNPKDVEDMVLNKIEERENSKRQGENLTIVRNKLTERFGKNYQNVLKEQAETLGLSPDDLNALARKSPNAFLRTLGLDRQEVVDNFQTPPRSREFSGSFKPTVQKRTWAYYQNMKKENPSLYQKPETAVQMQQDYIQLGDEFEDGDFRSL